MRLAVRRRPRQLRRLLLLVEQLLALAVQEQESTLRDRTDGDTTPSRLVRQTKERSSSTPRRPCQSPNPTPPARSPPARARAVTPRVHLQPIAANATRARITRAPSLAHRPIIVAPDDVVVARIIIIIVVIATLVCAMRCERLHRRRHPTPFFIYAYHITHRINLRQSRAVSRVHAQARKRASFRLEHHGRLASGEARVAQRRTTRAPRRSTSSTTTISPNVRSHIQDHLYPLYNNVRWYITPSRITYTIHTPYTRLTHADVRARRARRIPPTPSIAKWDRIFARARRDARPPRSME